MTVAAIFISAFAASAAGVYLFKRLASRSALLLDIPNERSSHSKPVVRGAGIAIVLTVLAGYLIVAGSGANLMYLTAAGMIAAVSFIDDLRSIPLIPRLIVHFAAAAMLVYSTGGYTDLAIPYFGSPLAFASAGPAVSVLFIVWVTNAFNFMDGIDGIAGVQGIGAGLGWMLFGLTGGHVAVAAFGAVIAGSCLGFLLFNWQPARVFMGDVGSTFLGFTLASVPLFIADTTEVVRSEGLWLAAVFLWLFLFDTIYTRLRQIIKLRPFWRPHREHLYQAAARAGSHRSVAFFFGLFALLAVGAGATRGPVGQAALLALLVAGPIALMLFARKKRLT